MKNCDSCLYFIKVKQWQDGRKGLCSYTDCNIINMKGGSCRYYKHKKYQRNKKNIKVITPAGDRREK